MAPRYSFLHSPSLPLLLLLLLLIFTSPSQANFSDLWQRGWFEVWPPAAKGSPLPDLHQITLGLGILQSPHSLSVPFSLTLGLPVRHVQSTLLIDPTMCRSGMEINLCSKQKCHSKKKNLNLGANALSILFYFVCFISWFIKIIFTKWIIWHVSIWPHCVAPLNKMKHDTKWCNWMMCK